jgi:hypothetical protein
MIRFHFSSWLSKIPLCTSITSKTPLTTSAGEDVGKKEP